MEKKLQTKTRKQKKYTKKQNRKRKSHKAQAK